MYRAFLRAINESNNYSVTTWRVAELLSEAQQMVYNEIVGSYLKPERPTELTDPMQFQGSVKLADQIAPFKRHFEGATSPRGWVANPTDISRYTAVSVKAPASASCNQSVDGYVPASYLRDNNRFTQSNNKFYRPVWEDRSLPKVFWYRPWYVTERVSTQPGIRILPRNGNIPYEVRLDYLINPPEIKVERTAYEVAQYAGNPEYTAYSSPNDVDSLFFDDGVLLRIVEIAAAQFLKEHGDYQAYNIEQQAAKTNN